MARIRRNTQPKKNPRMLLLKVAVFVASAYLVVSFISGQLQISAKQRELDDLQVKVEQQTDTNKELMRMMDSDSDDAYIERIAREKLGYARSNERVFVDLTGE